MQIVEKLMEYGANVNTQLSTNSRFAPIHTAALNGHVEVLEKLVQNGADVRGEVRGCPPTYYAATVLLFIFLYIVVVGFIYLFCLIRQANGMQYLSLLNSGQM
jgi:ankyrin repeat protein